MALTPGTRLGVYEVTAQIGEGGMGQVFQATDTKLKRQVAIKTLPPSLSADHDRLARFQREAEVLASLNHPNIAGIYGLEESGGITALVMELVEGEDLSQRIARGAIPLDEALPIAKQIADALEAAHERGIIHRDLKPANIKVRSDGTVKVLDFGLAKAMEPAAGTSPSASMSPTLSIHATEAGMILGTATYMSPEQARGKTVDKRADIWAFGAVLFEMLTGQRAFPGEDLTDTLAAVVKLDPKWDAVGAAVPARVRQVLRVCLQKDPRQRVQAIGDVRLALEGAFETAAQSTPATLTPRRPLVWWAATTAFAVLAIVGWWRPRPEASSPAANLAFTIAPEAGGLARVGDIHATPAISPDGTAVIFYGGDAAAGLGSGDSVRLRRLNQLSPEPVRTGRFTNPGFWSPDSRSFVFTDGTTLKKMRVPDGAPEIVVSDVAALVGGSWSDTGTLLFTTPSGLYSVPAAGGVARRIEMRGAPFESRGLALSWPEFLPGGEEFLVLVAQGIEQSAVYLVTLRDGRAVDPVLLMKNATAARYTPAGGGRLLFVRNDNLYAQILNRAARTLEGEPQLIQQRVASSPAFRVAHFSVSRTGVVAWRSGTAGLSQVTIFDRQGREIGTAGSPTVVQTLKLAPDETRLLIGFNDTARLLEPGRPGQQQLEQGALDTLWSSDGSKLLDGIPTDDRKSLRVVERPVTGGGEVRELARATGMGRLEDISPDSRTLLLSRGPLDTAVFSVELEGDQKGPKALVQTGETISHTRFSPDGRWIVFTASSVGGGPGGLYGGGGTYVQPYPGPGLRKQVTSRGNYPVWRKDGREIVYLDEFQSRNYVWSVPVADTGGEFRAGAPVPLFPARLPATTFGDLNFLAVSRDGSRFYIPQAVEQPESDVINVRMGWAK